MSLELTERDFWRIPFLGVFPVRYCIEPENRFLSYRYHLRKPFSTGMASNRPLFNRQRLRRSQKWLCFFYAGLYQKSLTFKPLIVSRLISGGVKDLTVCQSMLLKNERGRVFLTTQKNLEATFIGLSRICLTTEGPNYNHLS